MKILIYVRFWNKDFFIKLAKLMYPDATIMVYSDFRGLGKYWTGNYIYNVKYDSSLSEDVKQDIITRCRFLRGLESKKAEELCCRLYSGIEELFRTHKINMVLMPIIDCYSLDILDRVAKAKGIPVIAFCGNFIKGYSRFTVRGERIDLKRVVADSEVNTVYGMLTEQSYKPDFAFMRKVNKTAIIKRYVRNICKEKIYYNLKKTLDRDWDNYHFNTVGKTDLSTMLEQLDAPYFTHINLLSDINMKSAVYIPLHFTPEATVDYWSQNALDSYYEKSVEQIIKNADSSIIFLVKEHPSMMGRRNPDFYKRFSAFRNVFLIHPYDSSNMLLNMVDTVVVYTGSVGVEALLRNKRVLSFTKNYYSDIHPNITIIDKVTLKNITTPIIHYDEKLFLRDLLKGLFPYHYAVGWNVEKNSDNLEELAKWCIGYYNQLINEQAVDSYE